MVFFAVLILNLYPATTLRKLLIDAKRGEMFDRGVAVAAAVAGANHNNPQSIQESISRVLISENESIAIANSRGDIVYATGVDGLAEDQELAEALQSAAMGFDIFRCVYDEESFRSSITMPILRNGVVQGILHVSQLDADSSKLLTDIRNNILSISVAIAIFGGTLVALFVKSFSTKVLKLMDGVREIGSGNYSYKIRDAGSDELAQVAMEFNNLSERLKKVESIRQEFVSNASHELKTPLASIKLLSDSIMQTSTMSHEDTLDFLKDINKEIDRLIRITENLLYITKNDSRPAMPKEVCNVSKIARRCQELLTANARHNEVQITVRAEDDIRVVANSDMLHQVVFNIMENAIKYNREGGKVAVTLQAEKEYGKLTIEDNGIGMPEDEIAHIFDRFYRIDKARSRATGGTGLGLSIVHDNVGLMGGMVEVESKVGVGSKFTISLPLVQ